MRRATAKAPDTVAGTLREALRAALRSTSEHNSSDTVAPAAVLWTDRERWWEPVVPELREGLPLLTLGAYDPRTLTGPASWLRCALAGTLPELEMAEGTPIVYLPGVGRSDLRPVEDCPERLRALAELQYRGVVFSHRNGKDWTPAAFLGNVLGVEVVADAATRTAIARALRLRRLLEERGYQVLKGDETGAPSPAASAWTEGGDLDNLGHNRGWKMALDVERSVRDIASRVTQLLAAGWREVRVVTDHGWLLLPGGLPKVELPEHLTIVRKGRCARLKEGIVPEAPWVPWTLDPDIPIAVAPGIAAYEAGNEYAHGGLSPQECVVPVLTVTFARTVPSATITEVRWTGLRCGVCVEGAPEGAKVDLRTRAGDPSTSFTPAKPLRDGAASLPVADDTRESEASIVVLLDEAGRVLAQSATVVGG